MPKYKPTKPLSFYQEGSHYGNQSKTSRLISDMARQHISIGGVIVHIYRFKGIFDQDRDALGIKVDTKGSKKGATDIGSFMGIGVQDPILNENRDREYDFDEIPRLSGVYTVSQNELEYLRFGLALSNDILTMEFHTETMEKECGRRLIVGDVIELPHLREVGIDGRVANKWYEVSSITWSPTGYDPMYARHVSACILKPLRHQQEFLDLFERRDEYGKTLAEQASNQDALMSITEKIQGLAGEHASTTWFDTTMLWFDPDHPDIKPDVWTDDGTPPNGQPVDQGSSFPPVATDGAYYLRTDFVPSKLFRLQNGKWRFKEVDNKRDWVPYNWVEKLTEHMSDRSDAHKARKWDLVSIHDALTGRHDRSDPSPDDPTEITEPDEISDNKGRIG